MEVFKFRSGKHEGKTLEEVERSDPGYIAWIKENKPQMLKPTIKRFTPPAVHAPAKRIEPPEESEKGNGRLAENTDFLNQGPHGNLSQKIKSDTDE